MSALGNELILFRLYYRDGGMVEHTLMRKHLDRMLRATLQLHYEPGRNPHNNVKTSEARRIAICTQQGNIKTGANAKGEGPYWWSTPGLMDNGDPAGALIFDEPPVLNWSSEEEILWENPKAGKCTKKEKLAMAKLRKEAEELRAKRKLEKFTRKDLDEYVRNKIAKEVVVSTLIRGKWVLVGNTQVLLKDQASNMDDAYAKVVTRPNQPLLNWFYLSTARFDEGEWVMDWCVIPNTNIIIDFWYAGDGSEGFVLAAPAKVQNN